MMMLWGGGGGVNNVLLLFLNEPGALHVGGVVSVGLRDPASGARVCQTDLNNNIYTFIIIFDDSCQFYSCIKKYCLTKQYEQKIRQHTKCFLRK